MAIPPSATRVREALFNWFDGEITDVSNQSFETAKFLFGVSSASIGTFVAVSKFSGHAWGWLELTSLGLFVFSAATALWLAMPKVHTASAQFDLVIAQTSVVNRVKFWCSVWAILWVLALVFAAFGLLVLNGGNEPETETKTIYYIIGDQAP